MGVAQPARRSSSAKQPTSDGVIAAGMVRVGTLMGALPELRDFGVDVKRTLAEFGLEASYFDDPDNTIPYAIMGLLLRRCADLTRCPHFGLRAGQRVDASSLGTVGFLMRSAPDVRVALSLLSQYFHFHNPNATIALAEDDEFVTLVFTLLLPRLDGREQILDGAMAVAFKAMCGFCGPEWEPKEVRLARARPRDVRPYRELFRSAVIFDADETALTFHRRWLDTPLPTADHMLHLLMKKRVRELELSLAESLVDQVRRMLPPLVSAKTASVNTVATLVGLSARTLNRRLASEGTTFMQLREEARHTAACQLLESTALHANEISDRLGYTNPSAFTRAFNRWAGKAPVEWRASRKQRSRRRPRSGG